MGGVPYGLQGRGDVLDDGGHALRRPAAVGLSEASVVLGESEELLHAADSAAGCGRELDVGVSHGREYQHLVSGTGHGHVQPAPSSCTVDGSEGLGDGAVLSGTVSDREQDDVPLVSLDGLQVLDEHLLGHRVEPLVELGVLGGHLVHGVLDAVLLADAERDDSDALAVVVPAHDAPVHFVDHGLGLDRVVALPLLVDSVLDEAHADPGLLVVGGREGEHLAVVEHLVAKRYEALVLAAVVPLQIGLGHVQRQAVLEEALHVLDLLLSLLCLDGLLEEPGRGKLLPVSGDDGRLRPSQRSDGLAGGDLGRLVEDYQVEFGVVHGDVLGHGLGAHQQAGAELGEHVGDLAQKRPDGLLHAGSADGLVELSGLGIGDGAVHVARDVPVEPVFQDALVDLGVGRVQPLELLDEALECGRVEHAQGFRFLPAYVDHGLVQGPVGGVDDVLRLHSGSYRVAGGAEALVGELRGVVVPVGPIEDSAQIRTHRLAVFPALGRGGDVRVRPHDGYELVAGGRPFARGRPVELDGLHGGAHGLAELPELFQGHARALR